MALAYSVTLLADHKGVTAPKVVGDEYVVDALIDVTSHVAAGAEIPASALGLSSIHAVCLTGHEGANDCYPNVQVSTTGLYTSGTSFDLLFTNLDGTNNTAAADDADPTCAVRVRVWGNL